jgi:hypothetical protein
MFAYLAQLAAQNVTNLVFAMNSVVMIVLSAFLLLTLA